MFDVDGGFTDTSVYQRGSLAQGFRIEGPAIIEEAESTTIVGPGWGARLDETACLVLEFSGDDSA